MSSPSMDIARSAVTESSSNDEQTQEFPTNEQSIVNDDVLDINKNGVSESGPDTTPPSTLPGYLPWEEDMEMVSKYINRKVSMCFSELENCCKRTD